MTQKSTKGFMTMTRMLSTFLILLLYIGITPESNAEGKLNINPSSVKGLAQTYGFVLGQELSLERIKSEFPELKRSTTIASSKFDSSFPNIKSKLISQLTIALGKEAFRNVDKELRTNTANAILEQTITKLDANAFLDEVNKRAEGHIPPPIIDYILSVIYLSNPAREYFDGYRQRFSSQHHNKSQGINLTLQLPKSWKAKEGERPHIVQKWISQGGTGLDMIHLDIRDTEGYTLTDADVENLVSSGEVRSSVPNGWSHMDSGIFHIELRKGYWVEMAGQSNRAGTTINTLSIMYQLPFRGKAIGLMCNTTIADMSKNVINKAHLRMKPLCQQVLNSLVLLQAY
jgi:hypothetical protein